MKKYIIFIFVIIVVILIAIFLIFNKNNNSNNNNISATKTSTQSKVNLLENSDKNSFYDISQEKEISSYSTEIKDNSSGRLTNISITCSTLNNTIVSPSQTFSFNEIIGKPTVQKGYQEATVIIDHKTEKGIGGRKLSGKFYFI